MSSLAMALANIKAESDSLSVSNSHRGSFEGRNSFSRQGSFGNHSRGSTSRQSSFGSRQNSFGCGSALVRNSNVCKFYLQGRCTRGSSCPFRHEQSSGFSSGKVAPTISRSVCKFFLKGNCQRGSSCAFRHEIGDDDNISGVTMGSATPLPLQSSAGSRIVCKYFAKGYCSKGDSCTFLHETNSIQISNISLGNTNARYQPHPSVPREKPTIEAIRARAAKAKAKETTAPSLSSLVPKKTQDDESVLQAGSDLEQVKISPVNDSTAGTSTSSLAKAATTEKITTSLQTVSSNSNNNNLPDSSFPSDTVKTLGETNSALQNELSDGNIYKLGESLVEEKTSGGSPISILPPFDSDAPHKTEPSSIEGKSLYPLPPSKHAYSSCQDRNSCLLEKIEGSSQVTPRKQPMPLLASPSEMLPGTPAAKDEAQRKEEKPASAHPSAAASADTNIAPSFSVISSSEMPYENLKPEQSSGDSILDSGKQRATIDKETKDGEVPSLPIACLNAAVDRPEEVVQPSRSSLLAAASNPSSLQAAAKRKTESQAKPWKSSFTVKTSSLAKASSLSSSGVCYATEAALIPSDPTLEVKRSSLATASASKSTQAATPHSSLAATSSKLSSSLAAASSKPSSSLAAAASKSSSSLAAAAFLTSLSTTPPAISSSSLSARVISPVIESSSLAMASSPSTPTQASAHHSSPLGAASKPSCSVLATIDPASSIQTTPGATSTSPLATASSFRISQANSAAASSFKTSQANSAAASRLGSSLPATASVTSAAAKSVAVPKASLDASPRVKTSSSLAVAKSSSRPTHSNAPRSSLSAAASKPSSSLAAAISATSKQVKPDATSTSSLASALSSKISQANSAGASMLGSSLPATASVTLGNASLLADVAKSGLSQAAVAVSKASSDASPRAKVTSSLAMAKSSSRPTHVNAPRSSLSTAGSKPSSSLATAVSATSKQVKPDATSTPKISSLAKASTTAKASMLGSSLGATSTFTSSLGKASTTVKAASLPSSISAIEPNSSLASISAATSKGPSLTPSSLDYGRLRPEATSTLKTSSLAEASSSKPTEATSCSSLSAATSKLATSAAAPTIRNTSSLSAKLGPSSSSSSSVSNKSFLAPATQQSQHSCRPKNMNSYSRPKTEQEYVQPKDNISVNSTSYAAALNCKDAVQSQHPNRAEGEDSNIMTSGSSSAEQSNPDSELKALLGMSSLCKCGYQIPQKKLPPKRWGDESDSDSD